MSAGAWRNRLRKLHEVLVARPDKGRTRCLKGMDIGAVCAAVDAAINVGDQDVITAIVAHVEKAARKPLAHPRTGGPWYDDDGEQLFETHGFVYWLAGLQVGSWALPEPLPRPVLETFNAENALVFRR